MSLLEMHLVLAEENKCLSGQASSCFYLYEAVPKIAPSALCGYIWDTTVWCNLRRFEVTLNTITIFSSPDLGVLLESIFLQFCYPYDFVKNSYKGCISHDRMWSTGEGNGKPLQYSCLENPMNSMKRQKDRTLRDELSRSVGAQHATGDQWRNNSRKNEGIEPKQKQCPVVGGIGNRSKSQCYKE